MIWRALKPTLVKLYFVLAVAAYALDVASYRRARRRLSRWRRES